MKKIFAAGTFSFVFVFAFIILFSLLVSDLKTLDHRRVDAAPHLSVRRLVSVPLIYSFARKMKGSADVPAGANKSIRVNLQSRGQDWTKKGKALVAFNL